MAASICSDNFTAEIVVSADCNVSITTQDSPQIAHQRRQGNSFIDGRGEFSIHFDYIVGTGFTNAAEFYFEDGYAHAAVDGLTISHTFIPASPDLSTPTIAKSARCDVVIDIDSTGSNPTFTRQSNVSINLIVGLDTNGDGNAPDFVRP